LSALSATAAQMQLYLCATRAKLVQPRCESALVALFFFWDDFRK
jgi:hypothetical protein